MIFANNIINAAIVLHSNLHPAGQPEHDPVLAVHGHAVHQPGPQALVEPGDEFRQVLHALDKALDLPAADHDLIDLLDDRIAFVLGLFIPAHQRIVALVVFLLVLRHPGVAGDQVVHCLGVDAQPCFGSRDDFENYFTQISAGFA